MPLVSVIIPVYNAEPYLNECLDSVINQSVNDIEIICINDGSTDKSLDILQQYAENDSRIKIFSIENQGVSHARNLGLSKAEGKYVCFIDSDDYVDLDFCKKLLSKFSDEIDIVFGGHVKLNVLGRKVRPWLPQVVCTAKIFDNLMSLTKHRNVSQKMFRNTIIKQHNIQFNESLHYMEDALFLVTYLQYCKKARSVQEPLYVVRINSNSLCRSKEFKERREKEKQIALEKINSVIKKARKSESVFF